MVETGRYFSVLGGTSTDLKELALIEWEESVLAPSIQAGKPADYIFGLAENLISKTGFHETATSPAEVVLFSTLYDITERASPDLLSLYPSLKSWFLRTLSTQWGKQGVEQAAAQTSELPLEPTPAQGKAEQAFAQLVRDGAKMLTPEPGQDM